MSKHWLHNIQLPQYQGPDFQRSMKTAQQLVELLEKRMTNIEELEIVLREMKKVAIALNESIANHCKDAGIRPEAIKEAIETTELPSYLQIVPDTEDSCFGSCDCCGQYDTKLIRHDDAWICITCDAGVLD